MLRKYKSNSSHRLKALILLSSDENATSKLTAKALAVAHHTSEKMVERTRKAFCEEGMNIFEKKVRAVRSDKIYDARVEAHLLALSCQKAPNNKAEWTLQMFCDELVRLQVLPAASRSSVCQLLKKKLKKAF